MAIDSEAKRWSMLQHASGPAFYSVLFNPDTSGLSSIEKVTVLKLYGGISFEVPTATAEITGTAAGGLTPEEVVAGGKTLIIELTDCTWEEDVGDDSAATTALIAGLDSDGVEATGWDAVVKAGTTFAQVARTSATVVTITLAEFEEYAITSTETVTVTIPVAAVQCAQEIVATPTIPITVEVPVAPRVVRAGGTGCVKKRRRRYPRRVSIDGVLYLVRSPQAERALLLAWQERVDERAAELVLVDAPAPQVRAAKVKVVAVERRIEKLETREAEWIARLCAEDDELLLLLN